MAPSVTFCAVLKQLCFRSRPTLVPRTPMQCHAWLSAVWDFVPSESHKCECWASHLTSPGFGFSTVKWGRQQSMQLSGRTPGRVFTDVMGLKLPRVRSYSLSLCLGFAFSQRKYTSVYVISLWRSLFFLEGCKILCVLTVALLVPTRSLGIK